VTLARQETFRGRKRGKFQIRKVAEAVFSADPDAAFLIFVQAGNRIARQAVGLSQESEATILEATESGSSCSHPNHTMPIDE